MSLSILIRENPSVLNFSGKYGTVNQVIEGPFVWTRRSYFRDAATYPSSLLGVTLAAPAAVSPSAGHIELLHALHEEAQRTCYRQRCPLRH